jgi:hypothetical protein
MKIEQFSSLHVKGPCNILATTIQGSITWLLWLWLQRGRNLWSPQRFFTRKKMMCVSWIKKSLVFMMIKFGNVLSDISTYLKLHICVKIHWIIVTFMKCNSRTNNCLLYKWINQTTSSIYNKMMALITSSAIRKILFNPVGTIALAESMVVHTIKWIHQVMKHPGGKKVTWDVEPTSSSSQALVSDWCIKKLPSILTPLTGNIIFKISNSLESCQVKVNGWQVEFNALTCIDKASKLVKLISNNT